MNLFKLPVHPAAAVFPMLPDDELQQLADDIKANGLQVPVVVGEHEQKLHVIDGRNRLAACKLAGVEPEYRELNGQDAVDFIWSMNLRRDMSKGAKAMAFARLYPDAAKLKRKGSGSSNLEELGSRVSEARTVLAVLPELAEPIINGNQPLHQAYTEALRVRKDFNNSEKQLEMLRLNAADLAELVDAGNLTTTDALAACRERERVAFEQSKQQRATVLQSMRDALRGIHAFAVTEVDFDELFDASRDGPDFRRLFPDGLDAPSPQETRKFKAAINKLQELFQ